MHVRSPFQKAEIIALSLAQLTLHSKPELIGATISFSVVMKGPRHHEPA